MLLLFLFKKNKGCIPGPHGFVRRAHLLFQFLSKSSVIFSCEMRRASQAKTLSRKTDGSKMGACACTPSFVVCVHTDFEKNIKDAGGGAADISDNKLLSNMRRPSSDGVGVAAVGLSNNVPVRLSSSSEKLLSVSRFSQVISRVVHMFLRLQGT